MKKLWMVVNGLNIKKMAKNRIYMGIFILLNILVGAVVWLMIGRLFAPRLSGLLCFMGYPAIFIGFFGGIIYLDNNEMN